MELLALPRWLGFKPFGMARLAKKFGLVVAPSFNGAIVVPRCGLATRTLEEFRFWPTLWQQIGYKTEANYNHYGNAKNCIRRHELPLMPNY